MNKKEFANAFSTARIEQRLTVDQVAVALSTTRNYASTPSFNPWTWSWGQPEPEPLREILEGPMLPNRHARRKEAALKRRKK